MPQRFRYLVEEEQENEFAALNPEDIVVNLEPLPILERELRSRAVFGTHKKKAVEPKWEFPNVLETLEPYEKYLLKTSAHPVLSPVGVEEVRYYLSRNFGIAWQYTHLSEMLGLEENIQNHILRSGLEEHKVGGKFINRLSKVLHILYRITVTESHKRDLNKILEHHWVGGENFWIDRPTMVDWEAGEFGEKKTDQGSCWWYNGGLNDSDSRVSRFSAQMGNGYTGAVRLWLKDEEDFRGVGRVWFIRSRYGFPILFNGYGFTTMQWAAKLSRHFNVDTYQQVSLSVEPDLVINNNSGVAFGFPTGTVKTNYHFHLRQDRE